MSKTRLVVAIISGLMGLLFLVGAIVVAHNAVYNDNGVIPDAFPYASGMAVGFLVCLAAVKGQIRQES